MDDDEASSNRDKDDVVVAAAAAFVVFCLFDVRARALVLFVEELLLLLAAVELRFFPIANTTIPFDGSAVDRCVQVASSERLYSLQTATTAKEMASSFVVGGTFNTMNFLKLVF